MNRKAEYEISLVVKGLEQIDKAQAKLDNLTGSHVKNLTTAASLRTRSSDIRNNPNLTTQQQRDFSATRRVYGRLATYFRDNPNATTLPPELAALVARTMPRFSNAAEVAARVHTQRHITSINTDLLRKYYRNDAFHFKGAPKSDLMAIREALGQVRGLDLRDKRLQGILGEDFNMLKTLKSTGQSLLSTEKQRQRQQKEEQLDRERVKLKERLNKQLVQQVERVKTRTTKRNVERLDDLLSTRGIGGLVDPALLKTARGTLSEGRGTVRERQARSSARRRQWAFDQQISKALTQVQNSPTEDNINKLGAILSRRGVSQNASRDLLFTAREQFAQGRRTIKEQTRTTASSRRQSAIDAEIATALSTAKSSPTRDNLRVLDEVLSRRDVRRFASDKALFDTREAKKELERITKAEVKNRKLAEQEATLRERSNRLLQRRTEVMQARIAREQVSDADIIKFQRATRRLRRFAGDSTVAQADITLGQARTFRRSAIMESRGQDSLALVTGMVQNFPKGGYSTDQVIALRNAYQASRGTSAESQVAALLASAGMLTASGRFRGGGGSKPPTGPGSFFGGFSNFGGFAKNVAKAGIYTLGRAGLPIYAAGLGGAAFATFAGARASLQAYSDMQDQRLFLAGSFNRFREYRRNGQAVSPEENFRLAQMDAEQFYQTVRQKAVESPLTIQELFSAYTKSSPFLLSRGLTAEQSLDVINKVNVLGKVAGLRPETVADDIRALGSGMYRNVQSFQMLGVDATRFKDLSRLYGKELADALDEIFKDLNPMLEQYENNYSAKMARVADAFLLVGQTLGEALAPSVLTFAEEIVQIIKELEANGGLESMSNGLKNFFSILTDGVRGLSELRLPGIFEGATRSFRSFTDAESPLFLGNFPKMLETLFGRNQAQLTEYNLTTFGTPEEQKALRMGVSREAEIERILPGIRSEMLKEMPLLGAIVNDPTVPFLSKDAENIARERAAQRLVNRDFGLQDIRPPSKGKGKGSGVGFVPKNQNRSLGANAAGRASAGSSIRVEPNLVNILNAITQNELTGIRQDLGLFRSSRRATQALSIFDFNTALTELGGQNARMRDISTTQLVGLALQDQLSMLEQSGGSVQLNPAGFIRPVQGTISSGFGMRNHPILGRRMMHSGIDIAASSGTPVVAAGDGKVSFAGNRGGYGKTVIIDHGNGKQTLYGHLSDISVRQGQQVTQGQVIGAVGSTGRSTGAHLHFEVIRNGKAVDPTSYINNTPMSARASLEAQSQDVKNRLAKSTGQNRVRLEQESADLERRLRDLDDTIRDTRIQQSQYTASMIESSAGLARASASPFANELLSRQLDIDTEARVIEARKAALREQTAITLQSMNGRVPTEDEVNAVLNRNPEYINLQTASAQLNGARRVLGRDTRMANVSNRMAFLGAVSSGIMGDSITAFNARISIERQQSRLQLRNDLASIGVGPGSAMQRMTAFVNFASRSRNISRQVASRTFADRFNVSSINAGRGFALRAGGFAGLRASELNTQLQFLQGIGGNFQSLLDADLTPFAGSSFGNELARIRGLGPSQAADALTQLSIELQKSVIRLEQFNDVLQATSAFRLSSISSLAMTGEGVSRTAMGQFRLDQRLAEIDRMPFLSPSQKQVMKEQAIISSTAGFDRARLLDTATGLGSSMITSFMNGQPVFQSLSGLNTNIGFDRALSIAFMGPDQLRASGISSSQYRTSTQVVAANLGASIALQGLFGDGSRNYSREGGTIGSLVAGLAITSGPLAPFAGAIGLLGGGILGGLFGKRRRNPEVEANRQHQKKVEELLSNIEKNTDMRADFFRSIDKNALYGQASAYFSGRGLSTLGAQVGLGGI